MYDSEAKFYLGMVFAAAAVVAGFFIFNMESDADIARKPDVVQRIVDKSTQDCDLQAAFGNAAGYSQRLKQILMNTRTKALDTYADNDISVCLDQRLSHLQKGFFDSTVYATYHNNGQKTVTLWDNGKLSGEEGLFHTSITDWSDDALEKLAGDIRTNSIPQDGIMVAKTYTTNTGKTTTTHLGWYGKGDWGMPSGTLHKNPDILTPPLMK